MRICCDICGNIKDSSQGIYFDGINAFCMKCYEKDRREKT